MAVVRRQCEKCGKNRAEKFYVSDRGRVCSFCRRQRTRFASRETRLMEQYGITLDEYDAILASQDGKCGICKTKRPYNLDVDHDHKLEKRLLALGLEPRLARRFSIRGLLCKRCNRRLLPSCTDSVVVLQSAIDYLGSAAVFAYGPLVDAVGAAPQEDASDSGRRMDHLRAA